MAAALTTGWKKEATGGGPNWMRTKIVCTIGPVTQSVERLKELYSAGMRCARLNFSHGNHEYHAQTIANLRTATAGGGQVPAPPSPHPSDA